MKKRRSKQGRHRQGGPRLDIWLARHLQVALSSLGKLSRAPLSTMMTVTMIGIALALPTALHLLLNNAQTLSGSWDGAASISLFLKETTRVTDTRVLADRLRTDERITSVAYITPEEALEEFRHSSGFGDAMNTLESNPLPTVLIVRPEEEHSKPAAVEVLLTDLQKLPEVELAQLDLQWVRRFHAITEIARRGVLALSSLLTLAVLLIIGNTMRLEIQNRHTEIEVTKLVGATNAFIRRPFLYSGAWYGLIGGLIAWLLVSISLWLLSGPVEQLAGLYQSGFTLATTDLKTFTLLMVGGALLGLGGSWIAVGRHLNRIEPS